MKIKKYYTGGGILPPHNTIAEEIIIGSLLSEYSTRKNIIHQTHINLFTLKKHRVLYSYIVKTTENNKNNSIIKIICQLWTEESLQTTGGTSNIVRTMQKSQILFKHWKDYSHTEYCIQILKYHYAKRLFAQYSFNILQLSYIHNNSLQQIYNKSIQYLNILQNNYFRTIQTRYQNGLSDLVRQINQQLEIKKNILSGFETLDKITQGFKPGELIIIAGRPSMGKTSFAINIIYNAIINTNCNAYIFSLEMSREEILDKLISLSSNITLHKIQSKDINEHNWSAIHKTCNMLTQGNLYINDEGNASIEYIKSQCGNHSVRETLIVIDYLQLIKLNNESTENRSQQIGTITRELKLLAKRTKSPIITLSQLNRKIENRINKQPMLSDLRESGCVSCSNLPNIRKHRQINRIEATQCVNAEYIFNPRNQFQIHHSTAQYIYSCNSYTNLALYITHNHKLLTDKEWQKQDSIKQNVYRSVISKNQLNSKNFLEMELFKHIRLFHKEQVYDISLYEYCNFIIQQQIIHNSIEQDADLILMMYKKEDNWNNKKLDIVIAKHRNGPIGAFQLLFHNDKCKFESIEDSNLTIINKS